MARSCARRLLANVNVSPVMLAFALAFGAFAAFALAFVVLAASILMSTVPRRQAFAALMCKGRISRARGRKALSAVPARAKFLATAIAGPNAVGIGLIDLFPWAIAELLLLHGPIIDRPIANGRSPVWLDQCLQVVTPPLDNGRFTQSKHRVGLEGTGHNQDAGLFNLLRPEIALA